MNLWNCSITFMKATAYSSVASGLSTPSMVVLIVLCVRVRSDRKFLCFGIKKKLAEARSGEKAGYRRAWIPLASSQSCMMAAAWRASLAPGKPTSFPGPNHWIGWAEHILKINLGPLKLPALKNCDQIWRRRRPRRPFQLSLLDLLILSFLWFSIFWSNKTAQVLRFSGSLRGFRLSSTDPLVCFFSNFPFSALVRPPTKSLTFQHRFYVYGVRGVTNFQSALVGKQLII